MPVAIQMPNRREEKDPFDTILKGLQIAGSIYGIKEGREKASLLAKEAESKQKSDQIGLAAKDAELAGKGFQKQTDDKGNVSYLRPPGYVDLDDELKRSQIKKNLGDAKSGGDGGLSALIKEQRLRDMQRQAQEAEFAKTPEGRIQKLNSGDKARLDNAKLGLTAAQGMAEALSQGNNTFSIIGDNDFTQQRALFEEALGRMQSGGAISLAEENRFKKMAPTVFDSPEMQQKKLQQLQAEMTNRISTMGFTPAQLGMPGAPSDMVNVPKEMVAANQGGAFRIPGQTPQANAAPKPQTFKTNQIKWK